ncbi:GNAT family acetyltransferase [Lentzea sp. NPDC059081]|uniref:GNAT family acetyltransferase n=1 Tax=Lentzea sp. NPDC059081 TaxID=3346719 RepID=UPI00368E81C6
MQIRAFTDADTDAVVRLWQQAGITRPWNDPLADIRRKRTTQPEMFFVAADNDGEIAGVVMAGYDGHRGWIHYLAVATARRSTGLGRRLVGHAEAALSALGCPKVQLQVRPDNTDVVEFYERLGYEPYEAINLGKRLVAD